MTADVVNVETRATLGEIADMMQRHRIKRVPVLRDGGLVGIVTRGDLLKGMIAHKAEPAATVDDRSIHEQLLRELSDQPWAHLLDAKVENGVVHLYGTIQYDDERRALRIAAENVPGVKRVEEHLTPWSSAPIRHSGEGGGEEAFLLTTGSLAANTGRSSQVATGLAGGGDTASPML